MKQILKVNDIVIYNDHFNNGVANYVYCKITEIILDKENYKELEVTTGEGVKNTPCSIKIDYICTEKELTPTEECSVVVDPHKIFKPNFGEETKECLKEIELSQKRIEFFKKYENPSREKIIEIILENEN
jgi:hypothetical protein